jgi:hypothetical protein
VAGTVAPGYITPLHGLQRLEKIMDEYVGGYSVFYSTSEPMMAGLLLNRADYPKLDDGEWHVFTGSRYDAKTGE